MTIAVSPWPSEISAIREAVVTLVTESHYQAEPRGLGGQWIEIDTERNDIE